jgi:hypothetical protein
VIEEVRFPRQAQRMRAALGARYREPHRVDAITVPGMKHALAAEPGIEPAFQTAEASVVDAAITEWFSRYLA